MNRDPDKQREAWEFPYVSAVYIGPRTDKETVQKVIEKISEYEEKHNVSLQAYQMKFDDTTYELSAVPLL